MQFPFLPRWVSLSELLHFSQNKWVWNIPTMDDSSPQWNYDYLCVVSLFIKAFSHLLQPHPGNLFLSPSCFHLYTEILTVSLVFIYPLFRYTESSASRPIGRQREWSSYTEHTDTQQQAHLPASEPPSIYGISIIPPLYFLLLFPFIFTLLFPLWLSKVKKKTQHQQQQQQKTPAIQACFSFCQCFIRSSFLPIPHSALPSPPLSPLQSHFLNFTQSLDE